MKKTVIWTISVSLIFSLLWMLPMDVFAAGTEGFYHVSGTQIVDGAGNPVVLKGMSFDNCQWSNPPSIAQGPANDHDARSYFELAEMGLDHVRFDLNYGLFEDDEAPGIYKEAGFEWLDQNIAWAKAAGMKLILRMMHPQGGYQASSSVMVDQSGVEADASTISGGKPLWIDIGKDGKPTGGTNYQSLQQRLINLWKAIAKRYADEPTIIGYDLVNEPVVPQLATKEQTRNQWRDLAQRITDEIRTVDQNHIIFVQRLITWFNAEDYDSTDWNHMTEEETQVLIDDDNAVYEFHFFEPFQFTHQGADFMPQYENLDTAYPSDYVVNYTCSDWGSRGTVSAQLVKREGEWTYFESDPISLTSSYNFLQLQAGVANLNGGTVWFDDLRITRKDSQGQVTVVENHDFSQGLGQFGGKWFQYGGSVQWDDTVGHGETGGSLRISGASGQWDNANSWNQVFLDPECTYRVSGWVKGGTGQQQPQVSCLYAEKIWRMNKAYLSHMLQKYLAFGVENQVPMITEWGFMTRCCEEGRGAAAYTKDLTDLLEQYGVSSNYHSYHDKDFGLYPLPSWQERGERNEALYEILTTYFGEKTELQASTLTFLSEGETVASLTLQWGATVTVPTPQREGYTFCGWDQPVPDAMPEWDMTFHALWAQTARVTADGVQVDVSHREAAAVIAAGYDEAGRMQCVGLIHPEGDGTKYTIEGTDFITSEQVVVYFLGTSAQPVCGEEEALD